MNNASTLGLPAERAAGDPATAAVPRVVRLWQAIAAARAALRDALDPEPGSCQVLGPDAVEVLLPLAEAPARRLRMGELAERSHLTPSGLTRRVDRLETQGLVERVHCPADGRGAYSQLTRRGLQALQGALPYHGATLQRFVAPRLDEHAMADLQELLERLAAPRTTTDGATRQDSPGE